MASHDSADGRIPVTLVSGPLGAGKTTLVNRLLRETDRSLAVLVNDAGEINVDADLLRRESADGDGEGEGDEGIVDLSNGCICCRLQSDLLTEMERLADRREFDALVIESSGISEPVPVARTLVEGSPESDVDPTERYRLDTAVSVIDAYGFSRAFDADSPSLDDRDDDRPLTDVLVDAVEFCDVLLLNKCDTLSPDRVDEVEAAIRELQPRAEITRTEYADVPPEAVIDTGRFDLDTARQSAGWKRRLAAAEADGADAADRHHGHGHGHAHDHAGEDEPSAAARHGVTTFVYDRERPFHPERLDARLDEWDGDVLRAKGVFRLAGRDRDVMGLSRAGPSVQAGPIGEWDDDDDPRTRLVFIGTHLDEAATADALDDCLATDEELATGEFADPFPTS